MTYAQLIYGSALVGAAMSVVRGDNMRLTLGNDPQPIGRVKTSLVYAGVFAAGAGMLPVVSMLVAVSLPASIVSYAVGTGFQTVFMDTQM